MKANYHTHSLFCDGQEDLSAYAQRALKDGFDVLGFSGHAPVPLANEWTMKPENLGVYHAKIEKLKEEFAGRLEILGGLEADYVRDLIGPGYPQHFGFEWDFMIGAVHFYRPAAGPVFTWDGPREEFDQALKESFAGDPRAFCTAYFEAVRELCVRGGFQILAHLDVIRKNGEGRHFSGTEYWYLDQVDQTLELVREADLVLEVNVGGMSRKRISTPYPSPGVLHRVFEMGIPVCLNADAHHPDHLDSCRQATLGLLHQIGFQSLRLLSRGEWRDIPLEDCG